MTDPVTTAATDRTDEQLRTCYDLTAAAWEAARGFDGRTREGRAARRVAAAVGDRVQTIRPGVRPVPRPEVCR